MTAQYRDEVAGLTVDECYAHPQWPRTFDKTWIVREQFPSPPFFVREYRRGRVELHVGGCYFDASKAACDALATLLPERPKPFKVTDEDRALADAVMRAASGFTRSDFASASVERAAHVIAEYRVKHSSQ